VKAEPAGNGVNHRRPVALDSQDAGADKENAPSLSRRQNGLSGATMRGAQELAERAFDSFI
jgi:hypothetical protein